MCSFVNIARSGQQQALPSKKQMLLCSILSGETCGVRPLAPAPCFLPFPLSPATIAVAAVARLAHSLMGVPPRDSLSLSLLPRSTTPIFDHNKQYMRAKTVTPFSINDDDAISGGTFNPLASLDLRPTQAPTPLTPLSTPLSASALLLRHGGSSCKMRPGRALSTNVPGQVRGKPLRSVPSIELESASLEPRSGSSSASAASSAPANGGPSIAIAEALHRIATALEGLVDIERGLSGKTA